MRKPIVVGNWKMNNTVEEGTKLIEDILRLIDNDSCDVVVCPPFTSLSRLSECLKGTSVKLGAQNMHFAPSGAYTGEISAPMLKESGVEYVILGHSERRCFFGETDESVNKRARCAVDKGLIPIVCVGETLTERNGGITEEVLARQVEKGLCGIYSFSNVIVAYEPVWAIGTGMVATKEQANEAIGFIRKTIEKLVDKKAAETVRILYGGSVKPSNAEELFDMSEIDGGLIGGASLDASEFAKIVNSAK